MSAQASVTVRLYATATNGVDDKPTSGRMMSKVVDLPYLPRVNDTLGVGPDDDFMTVESVWWSRREGFVLWFPLERGAIARMAGDGWSVEGEA